MKEKGNVLEVIDLVEELQVVPKKREGGGKGKGGFSHLEIRADYGRRRGPYLYVRATTLLSLPVTQGGHAEIHTAYLSLLVK